jgi:putative tricarboxylic transport membrane protein
MAIKDAGIDPKSMKLVVFNSAGQAVMAAVGGHADVVLSITETVKPQLQENRVRILAISAPKRPAEGPLATVPTLIEQGVNVAFRSWRGVLGPRNMPPAQIAYWDAVFARMVATEDWKKELALYDAANEYQNSAGSRVYLKAQYDQLKAILTELGLARN